MSGLCFDSQKRGRLRFAYKPRRNERKRTLARTVHSLFDMDMSQMTKAELQEHYELLADSFEFACRLAGVDPQTAANAFGQVVMPHYRVPYIDQTILKAWQAFAACEKQLHGST